MSKDETLLDQRQELAVTEEIAVGADAAPLKLRLMILACICSLTLGSYWVF